MTFTKSVPTTTTSMMKLPDKPLTKLEHAELLAELEHTMLKMNKTEMTFLKEYLENPYLNPSAVARRCNIDPVKSVVFLQRPHIKTTIQLLKLAAYDYIKTTVDVKVFLSEVINGNVTDLMGPATIDTKIRAAGLLIKLEDIQTPKQVEIIDKNPDVNSELERSKYIINELIRKIADHQGSREVIKVLSSTVTEIKENADKNKNDKEIIVEVQEEKEDDKKNNKKNNKK